MTYISRTFEASNSASTAARRRRTSLWSPLSNTTSSSATTSTPSASSTSLPTTFRITVFKATTHSNGGNSLSYKHSKRFVKVRGGQLFLSAGHIAPLFVSRGANSSQLCQYKANKIAFAGHILPRPVLDLLIEF